MTKIDIDRFICDCINAAEDISPDEYFSRFMDIPIFKKALNAQNLEYKNGEIVEIDQPPLAEEQKPNPCENCSIATNNCQKFPCAIRYGEQKPADKIEPKFKVEKDKWYVCTSQYCNCIEGRNYKASLDGRIIDDYGTEYDMHSDAYRWFRPWTIQDAKVGDVLYNEDCKNIILFNGKVYVNDEPGAYCGYDIRNGELEIFELDHSFCSNNIHPTTKYQRDMLNKKMEEAGYTWNQEELKLEEIDKPQTIKFKTNDDEIYQDKSPLFQDSFDALEKRINSDEVNIEKMVAEYKEGILISQSLTYDDLLVRAIAYKKGLEDMLKLIKEGGSNESID